MHRIKCKAIDTKESSVDIVAREVSEISYSTVPIMQRVKTMCEHINGIRFKKHSAFDAEIKDIQGTLAKNPDVCISTVCFWVP